MTTEVADDNLMPLDWERLTGWLAGLCRRDRDNRCLPAALWLVCRCQPPVPGPLRPAASEVEALAELISQLQEGIPRLGLGQARPQAGESQEPPLSWRAIAQSLQRVLRAEPDRFRPCLWLTINCFRHYPSELDLDEPAATQIRAVLDYLDLYHPDLVPAVRRMTSSVPAAREVVTAWQPLPLSSEEKIVSKMLAFADDVLRAVEEDPQTAAVWTEKVSGWQSDLVRAAVDRWGDLRWGEFPVDAFHQLDQLMDDPNLSILGKLTAMREVLLQGLQGAVVCH
jgi:hypothetical protein